MFFKRKEWAAVLNNAYFKNVPQYKYYKCLVTSISEKNEMDKIYTVKKIYIYKMTVKKNVDVVAITLPLSGNVYFVQI